MHNQMAGTVGCKGHGRRSDPLVPGTHWILRQFLSCKNLWEGNGGRERERESERAGKDASELSDKAD